MRIQRLVRGYHGQFAGLNSPEVTLPCKRVDLMRCAITVGAPIGLTLASISIYGWPRALYTSIAEKALLIWQNVDAGHQGLRRAGIFETHTSGKKGDVSELVGLAVAKFNAEKLLDIIDLIHVEALKKQRAITFFPGSKKEPDLAGQDRLGRWHIFEAKGRSTNRSSLNSAIHRAKAQAAAVNSIYGAMPTTRSVSATFFGTNEIYSIVEDPPGASERSIEINDDRFVEAYYAPYFMLSTIPELSKSEAVIDGLSMNTIEIPFRPSDATYGSFTLGLATDVVRAYESGRYSEIGSIVRGTPLLEERASRSEKYSFGLDGFFVGLPD